MLGFSKESAWNVGDLSLIPGSGRSSGEGNGNWLQYSYLENHMDEGNQQAIGHRVAESWTQLSDFIWLSYLWGSHIYKIKLDFILFLGFISSSRSARRTGKCQGKFFYFNSGEHTHIHYYLKNKCYWLELELELPMRYFDIYLLEVFLYIPKSP